MLYSKPFGQVVLRAGTPATGCDQRLLKYGCVAYLLGVPAVTDGFTEVLVDVVLLPDELSPLGDPVGVPVGV